MAWSTAPTFVTGTPLAAADLNKLGGDLNIVGGAWSAYTPTVTNLSVGNGTLNAWFLATGKTTDFFIRFLMGSTSVVTSPPTFSLPATAQRTLWTADGTAFDTSASVYYPVRGVATDANTLTLYGWPSTAGNNLAAAGANTPMTWATGDALTLTGRYEGA